MEGNHIGGDGAVALQEMLERNYTIVSLGYTENDLDPITTSFFTCNLDRNYRFNDLRKAFSSTEQFQASTALLESVYRHQSFLQAFPVETLLESSAKGRNSVGFEFALRDSVIHQKRFPVLSAVPSLFLEGREEMLFEALKDFEKTTQLATIHNEVGESLLHWAVSSSQCMSEETAMRLVRLLLDAGCDPNEHTTKTGVTPFLLVQNKAVLDELLERDADFGACDLSGCGADSYFTTELLRHLRAVVGAREFHGTAQDFIFGVFGGGMGCRALPGTLHTASEQLIETLVSAMDPRDNHTVQPFACHRTSSSGSGSSASVPAPAPHDRVHSGAWWTDNESCPQRMPLGCFPMLRVRALGGAGVPTAELPVVRVCDFERLSPAVSLPVGTVVVCAVASDRPEQNQSGFWEAVRASLQRLREKNADLTAVLLHVDSSAEASVTQLLRQRGAKHVPASDALYRAKECGFDAFAELATADVAAGAAMLVERCLALHCRQPQPQPEGPGAGGLRARCAVRVLTPFVAAPPLDEQHGRSVKVVIVNQEAARIGAQAVVDHVLEQKKHALLRGPLQRAPLQRGARRGAQYTSSRSLFPIRHYVEFKSAALPEHPGVVANIYAFAGTADVAERLLLEQVLSPHGTLYVLCVNLSDTAWIDALRDWLEFLEGHPCGPSPACQLLVLCSFFAHTPPARAVNPPWAYCQACYEQLRAVLREWAAGTKIPVATIQVCDKKLDGRRSLQTLDDLNTQISEMAYQLACTASRVPPFFDEIASVMPLPLLDENARTMAPPRRSGHATPSPPPSPRGSAPAAGHARSNSSGMVTTGTTGSSRSTVGTINISSIRASSAAATTASVPDSPRTALGTTAGGDPGSGLGLADSLRPLTSAISGMMSSDGWTMTADVLRTRLPRDLLECIDRLPNPAGAIEDVFRHLHMCGTCIYFCNGMWAGSNSITSGSSGRGSTSGFSGSGNGNSSNASENTNGGVCCLNPCLFISAFEGLCTASSFLSLGGCLSFDTLRMRLCAAVDVLDNEHHVAQLLLLLQACGLCTLHCQPGTAAQAFVFPSLCPLPQKREEREEREEREQHPFRVNDALPLPPVRLLHCRCLAHVCRACHAVIDSDERPGSPGSPPSARRAGSARVCPACGASAPLDSVCVRGCKHCTKRARLLARLTPYLRIVAETPTALECVPIVPSQSAVLPMPPPSATTTTSDSDSSSGGSSGCGSDRKSGGNGNGNGDGDGNGKSGDGKEKGTSSTSTTTTTTRGTKTSGTATATGSASTRGTTSTLVLPKNMVHCRRCFDVLQAAGGPKDGPKVGRCFYRVRVLNTDYTFSGARLLSMLVSRFAHALLVDGFTAHMDVRNINLVTPSYASFADAYGNVVTLWVACQVPYAVRRDPARAPRAVLGSNMDATVFAAARGLAPLRALDAFPLAFLGTVEPLCPICAFHYDDYGVELRRAPARRAADPGDQAHPRPNYFCTARHHAFRTPAFFADEHEGSV